MTETAGFVLFHREVFVEDQKLSQRTDLALPVKRRLAHSAKSVGLDAIEMGLYRSHVAFERSGHAAAARNRIELCLGGGREHPNRKEKAAGYR
jgi:hypothetical protein